jgi:phage terminase large subunit-like protein
MDRSSSTAAAKGPDASVYVGAASRDQARIIGDIVRRYARHPAVAKHLTVRHDEVRFGDRHGSTALRIVASDGARAYGWARPTLMVGDEVWAWSDRDPTLLGAMTTALVKNPACRLLLISTAPAMLDTPLGRIRERALSAPDVRRDGPRIDARGNGLRWLEWSVPDDQEATPEAVWRATPAPWITRTMLAEQRLRTVERDWLTMHANRSHVSSARWLPVGAWQGCRADCAVGDDEPLTLGVDIGGSRSTTALVGCVADGDGVRVALVEVRTGKAAVLAVTQSIRDLVAQGRPVAQVVYDPMRWEVEALRLEADLGLVVIEWPQTETRMTRCSENLHRLIVEGRFRHAGHPTLDAHIANAEAKPTPRGWRLVKRAESAHIDAAIALAMAAECAEKQPATARVLGWA